MEATPVPEHGEPARKPKGSIPEPEETTAGPKELPTGQTTNPNQPTPESKEPKKPIPKPARLYQQKPADIYSLVKIPHSERLAILERVKEIYKELGLKDIKEAWRNLPQDLQKDAMTSFADSYPHIASRCEENWFASYVFYRRHKTNLDELARARKRNNSKPPDDQRA